MSNTPKWKKELTKKVNAEASRSDNFATQKVAEHNSTANVHRAIYVSTSSPLNTNGNDGDIWIVYEA